MRPLSVLGLVILLSGCTHGEQNWEIVHPVVERLPADSLVHHSLDISKKDIHGNTNPLSGYTLKAVASLSQEGNNFDENYFYKNIPQNIDIDPEGNIYIVQKHSNSIMVYDPKGVFKYRIGSYGKGPGEFISLRSFAFSKDYQKIYALDWYKIEIFNQKNDRFIYETTKQLNLIVALDFCRLGNSFFVSGYTIATEDREAYNDGSIYEVQAKVTPPITRINLNTFEHTGSFGYQYKSFSGFGRYDATLSEPLVSCNEKTMTVISHLKHFPYIIGYTPEGKRKWISKLNGYKSTKFIEYDNAEYPVPRLIPIANEHIFDFKLPTANVHLGNFSILQLRKHKPQKYYASVDDLEITGPKYRTIIIDSHTGKLFYSDSFDIIGSWKDGKVVTSYKDESDQIDIRINEIK